jgi:HSP90 family molecular chaperone
MEDEERWFDFYDNYHQFIKMGVIRDSNNRGRLSKLLRFYSAKSPEKVIYPCPKNSKF